MLIIVKTLETILEKLVAIIVVVIFIPTFCILVPISLLLYLFDRKKLFNFLFINETDKSKNDSIPKNEVIKRKSRKDRDRDLKILLRKIKRKNRKKIDSKKNLLPNLVESEKLPDLKIIDTDQKKAVQISKDLFKDPSQLKIDFPYKRNNPGKKHLIKPKDWDKINLLKGEIGLLGETLILELERSKIAKYLPEDQLQFLEHTSQSISDNCGYDIQSLNKKGDTIYIEVKSTISRYNKEFYLTVKELETMNLYKANYFIYRIYNLNIKSKSYNLIKISAKELLKNYVFEPNSYRVKKKL